MSAWHTADDLPVLMLTREQAAAVCQVGEGVIDNWTHRAGFPVIREGRIVRIPLEPLKAWLSEQATSPSVRIAAQLAHLPVINRRPRGA